MASHALVASVSHGQRCISRLEYCYCHRLGRHSIQYNEAQPYKYPLIFSSNTSSLGLSSVSALPLRIKIKIGVFCAPNFSSGVVSMSNSIWQKSTWLYSGLCARASNFGVKALQAGMGEEET